ncbi:uncharacterized protein PITG_12648 [Phytophthora infestans T30-4]|uniref:Uncharacterized protein n=1 Tax=Phytophthora infestans (strain T30-4) TaxID=403677 RepID=D0NNF6_PHYIT|nr:uncharacterized protein PITG_12648 [Phytophthora infestans T30-4]EEY62092.1 conserved hypothetical protein [Phytophthora infestans T30-4]|eukprot:XP_002899396.1 conserved hypothetical protein [Phytophthora infestans T30-4]
MAKDIALDLDEEAEAADDQLVGAGSKNRETTAVDEPDYINKDDGENLAEITGAGDGETAACPLPVAGPRSEPPQAYGDHPSGNEQHPTSRSEVKRRRSADEAETPSSGDGGQEHFRLIKPPRPAIATSEALATNDKKGSGTKEGIAARTRSQLRRAPYPATNTPGDQERRASDVGRTPEQGAANCDGSQGDAIDDAWQSPIPAGCSRRRAKRSENAVDADIGHVQGVTCWNFRLNDWVIDLTAKDQSEYGLANTDNNYSGKKGSCVVRAVERTTQPEHTMATLNMMTMTPSRTMGSRQ